ncbi:DNA glycosylase AlkZ-like family protein [Jatrophihabitans sp. GAS493]|uniref:winged helix-turn-helix domain-containing protein n=1 Tax=Jatrophihabitans sp. GAS493 TaxID=1907575 RepID=UPI000BB95922
MTASRFTASQARRISLAAQGFADPSPTGRVDARHIRRVIDRVGLLQLDSVNVFSRSHYLPIFSRLGPYRRELLDELTAHTAGPHRRELVEYWAHEASLIPVELHPFLRWRMARADREAWGGMVRIAADFPELVEEVFDLVRTNGPIRAADTGIVAPQREAGQRAAGQMWNWHDGKLALEYLFWSGRITAARRVNFERRYDLPERVLPPEIVNQPSASDADQQRQLVRVAARSMGIATEPDLGDYFRLPRAESKLRVAELVDAGELETVQVDGWTAPAYLWPAARIPRRVQATALLSPFDSLIWFRERTQRLFDFRYRIEIYTPEAKRTHGYYVLPFLLGEHLTARVDLKSDRQARVLRVQGAYLEDGFDGPEVAEALAGQLWLAAEWLELDDVVVTGRGDLAAPLTVALKAAANR